jgi:hypothetical protein
MQIYRATRRLTTGHEQYAVVLADELGPGVAEILLERGILTVAGCPPLVELPGWKRRGRMLAEIGIHTIHALLDAEHEEAIIRAFRLGKASTIDRWRWEALSWLKAPARDCRRC